MNTFCFFKIIFFCIITFLTTTHDPDLITNNESSLLLSSQIIIPYTKKIIYLERLWIYQNTIVPFL